MALVQIGRHSNMTTFEATLLLMLAPLGLASWFLVVVGLVAAISAAFKKAGK